MSESRLIRKSDSLVTNGLKSDSKFLLHILTLPTYKLLLLLEGCFWFFGLCNTQPSFGEQTQPRRSPLSSLFCLHYISSYLLSDTPDSDDQYA